MKQDTIDLSKCKKGDILISRLGEKFEYVEPTRSEIYPHRVKFLYGKYRGYITSRTNDGHVFRDSDGHINDIVEIEGNKLEIL